MFRAEVIVIAVTLAGALIVGLAAGCGADESAACRVGADCASGVCAGDGTCVDPDATDAATQLDGQTDVDGAPETTDATPGDGATHGVDTGSGDGTADIEPGLCVPVDDDMISRAEVPLRAGLYATFRIATEVAVDLFGTPDGDGRRWDFAGALDGDADVRVDLGAITGQWFATDFPGATYTARLSTGEDYLGVFELTDSALLLRGVVSPDGGLFATKLTYDPAVEVLRFPLALGDTWTTDTTATGTTLGVPSFVTETYASEVDAEGTLVTPFGTFSVLRVRTTLTRTVGLLVTTTRQMAFVSPCFGSVALVVSEAGETEDEFETAAEIRRLAP